MSEKDYNHVLQFFTYEHLPEHLQKVSKPFCDLAGVIMATLPSNPERTKALNKLLESKDAAVRALVAKKIEQVTKKIEVDVDKVSCPNCHKINLMAIENSEDDFVIYKCHYCNCEWKIPDEGAFQKIIIKQGKLPLDTNP